MPYRHAKPLFRRALQELHEENGNALPSIFTDSVDILRQRGLQTRGLFLGCAEERKVRLLERAWDQGQNPLRLAKVQDCYAVAESLLTWLRSLPYPIVPCKLFRSFLRIRHCHSQSESLSQLHYLFQQMDDCELQLLVRLLEFLHDYQACQREQGFMTPSLGQVFGPVLLRAHEGPLPLPFPEDTRAATQLVDDMILDFAVIFSHPPPCSSAAHKPPSRAKRQAGGLKRELAAKMPSKDAHSPGSISKFDARAPHATRSPWPGKHLRVVVVPPFQDAELCFMDSEDNEPSAIGTPERHEPPPCMPRHSSDDDAFSFREPPRLATVPEGGPLGSAPQQQDPDLDHLVGALLCGSMESMLFENDDNTFLARTSSLLSCPSSRRFCGCGASGESTDPSSDEDMPDGTESPASTPRHCGGGRLHGTLQPHHFADEPLDLREWVASGPSVVGH